MIDRPDEPGANAELRRLLGQLGQEPGATRSGDAERQRAARVATNIDVQLAQLVAATTRRRWWTAGALSAAAAVALAVGWSPKHDAHPLAITAEPAASNCALVAPPAKVEPEQVAPTPPPRDAAPRISLALAPATPSVARTNDSAEAKSTLAEENRLFQRAADASRDGDVAGALAELERLLQEHPTSPLAQTALVKKFRLLAKAGRSAEAKQEAERYLASYPQGFAVREAESMAGATAVPTPSALAEPASPGR